MCTLVNRNATSASAARGVEWCPGGTLCVHCQDTHMQFPPFTIPRVPFVHIFT